MSMPEEDEEIKKLYDNITLCMESITFTKTLI